MKWASWTNLVLGLWLIIAPFSLAYAAVTAAVYEDVILGIVVASLALWRALARETPEMAYVSWTVAVGGLWVLIAPFALGYNATTAAAYNDVIVGLAVLILATWRAVSRPQGEMPHMAAHH